MNLLYILFTLVMDSKIPISNIHNTLPFSRPITNGMSGMNEVFPMEENEMDKIWLNQYYLDQIGLLESYVKTLEEVIKDPIVQEVLPIYEISPHRIKMGGLMNDWERNI